MKVDSFRTKETRDNRDAEYSKIKPIWFLNETFRYWGKDNYEDEIYLALHNTRLNVTADKYIQSLCSVASKFIRIASFFCMHKIEKKEWDKTIIDINNKPILIPDIDKLDTY